jgi:peptidylprolyl isomerase
LFANQSALDVASLKAYAAQLGLETATFNDCLDTGKHTAEVQKDSQDARSQGITGTPTFLINGQLVKGAQPFSTFQQVIDAALASEGEAEQTPTPEAEGGPPSVAGEPTVTPSGLQYIDIEVGSGEQPQAGQTVVTHYTGWLADGTKFDSSVDRGQPFSFTLGAGRVIEGWDEGVATMRVGGKRRLIIPPELAYGESGASPNIPPNAELIFDVELIEIQ